MALRKKLVAIAITDHDTVEGVAIAQKEAQGTGLEVVAGVELSVNWKGRAAHLLGYCFDCADGELNNGFRWIQEGRDLRNQQIIERLAVLDCPIDMEELRRVAGAGLIGRPHFAKLLIEKGLVHNMEEAFRCYLGAEGKAYIPRRSMELAAAVTMLHQAGGVAVVAHPFTLGYNEKELGAEVAEMAAAGLDGLEVFYPKHSKAFIQKLRLLTGQHGMIETGGSDYHSSIYTNATLADGKNVFVSAQLLKNIRQRALLYVNSH